MKLIYDGEVIGTITTNRSLNLEECFDLLNIDVNEMDGGDPKWDYELFEMDYTEIKKTNIMLYKNYEIFKDDLGRTCIYNTASQYSKDSDHIVVNGNTKDAKREIDNRVSLSQAASAMGKLGGSSKSTAKTGASRANGKLGGRPKKAQAEKDEN